MLTRCRYLNKKQNYLLIRTAQLTVNNLTHKLSDINKLILFDGNCGLCNRSVNFILRKEINHDLLFSPLHSEFAKYQLKKFQLKTDSIVYIRNQKAYTKSGAVLRICLQLKGFWPVMIVFMAVPWFIRDFIYDYVAKNRLQWFRKSEYCSVMNQTTIHRFVTGI